MTPPCSRSLRENKRIKFLIFKSSLHLSWIKKSIIQWNCRGLKANYNEILILTTLLSPTVFCLQETFLKNTDNINFKNYSLYNHIATENQKASGGSSIIVKSNVPHRQIDINSNLQAVAVNVTLSKSITICSLYLPPHCKFSKHDLENLINQLPRPYLLLGDSNSHSKLWGCLDTNDKGEIIENFIAENDLCLFNDKQPTINNQLIFILLQEIILL